MIDKLNIILNGKNVTGIKGYENYPYKTFTTATTQLLDGDLLRYTNTDETINGINILPSNTSYNFDLGDGNITLSSGGNALIGNNGWSFPEIKNINIKSKGLFNVQKTIRYGKGNVSFELNNCNVSNWILATKGNIDIKINSLNSTINYTGFYSGQNNNINIDVNSLTVNGPQTIPGWNAGCFVFEATGGELTDNCDFNLNINNVKINSASGTVCEVGSGPDLMQNSRCNINVKNIIQESSLGGYAAYPNNNLHFSNLFTLFRSNGGGSNIQNVSCNIDVGSSTSDVAFIHTGSMGITSDCKYYISAKNHVCNKMESIILHNNTHNNLKLYINGNFTNTTTKNIIEVGTQVLNNNSVIQFDGNYSANGGIRLANLILDATSKIVFKGRYELGNGSFDISGVTGAGADNVYFEDCTIITNNTECIISGTAKNIKILDVRSNKPTNVNVTETIQSITINTNIN